METGHAGCPTPGAFSSARTTVLSPGYATQGQMGLGPGGTVSLRVISDPHATNATTRTTPEGLQEIDTYL